MTQIQQANPKRPRRGRRSRGDPDVLIWQSTIRLLLAVGVGGVLVALVAMGVLRGSVVRVTVAVAGYAATVLALRAYVSATRRVEPWVVAATISADLLVLFVAAVVSTAPQYYTQILLFSFIVVHLTEFNFGRFPAVCATAAVVVLYGAVVMAALRRGDPLVWQAELWSLGVFVLATGTFLYQYGDLKRRLRRLVRLFGRAESGDFTEEYNVVADRRPDSITAVGRAYNRMRAQLTALVLQDPLSGCFNRRGFDQLLALELARGGRAAQDVALLAIDVDHFKRINDTYGHLAGDQVIREVGALLRETARANDVVARIGGEEFVILAPDTTADGAYRLATRIAATFRQHQFTGVPSLLPITVSMGVVAERAAGGDLAEDLRARADEALYAAKRGGRDCVVLWREGLERSRDLGSGGYRVVDGAREPAR